MPSSKQITSQTVDFGYYPEHCNIDVGPLAIRDLPNFDSAIKDVASLKTVHEDWVCAPSGRRVFGLPKTHVLTHSNPISDNHLEFVVWCLGFFVGMRLTTYRRGFLDLTALKTNRLTDFYCSNIKDAMTMSDSYYVQNCHDTKLIKLVLGIINSLFIAQNPTNMHFETFIYLYTAIDACYELKRLQLSQEQRISHYKRVDWVCQEVGISTPVWAEPDIVMKKSEVSGKRNQTLHEALFFDEPLGFLKYDSDPSRHGHALVLLQMKHLVCRLLVALLGKPDCNYVRSPVSTRDFYELDFA
jgi:hypothetical protein